MNSTRLSACARRGRASSRARSANTAIVPSASDDRQRRRQPRHAPMAAIASRWTSWSSGNPARPATSFCTPSRQPSPCGRRSTATGAASATPTRTTEARAQCRWQAFVAGTSPDHPMPAVRRRPARTAMAARDGCDRTRPPPRRPIATAPTLANTARSSLRCRKRGFDGGTELPAGGQFVAIAEDRVSVAPEPIPAARAPHQPAAECDRSRARDAGVRRRAGRDGYSSGTPSSGLAASTVDSGNPGEGWRT